MFDYIFKYCKVINNEVSFLNMHPLADIEYKNKQEKKEKYSNLWKSS